MNIYFLVEGKRTERKVYPAWLAYLLPELQQVNSKRNPGDVLKQYYLEQILKRIEDKNNHLPSFKYFIDFCQMIKQKL